MAMVFHIKKRAEVGISRINRRMNSCKQICNGIKRRVVVVPLAIATYARNVLTKNSSCL